MSIDVNRVTLYGGIATDPCLRETRLTGQSVCNFKLVTNTAHGYGSRRHERSTFHKIVAWGQKGEYCAEFLRRGDRAFIRGELQNVRREDQNGITRLETEIVADKVHGTNKRILMNVLRETVVDIISNGVSPEEIADDIIRHLLIQEK